MSASPNVTDPHSTTGSQRGLAALLPPLQWLPNYRGVCLRADLIAGVTLAAYAIPVSLAYATLAGLPPPNGIYCYLVGGVCYAFDRVLCSIFGAEAVERIAAGDFGKMVAYQGDGVTAIPIADAVGKLKTVRPGGSLARTVRAMGICLGD